VTAKNLLIDARTPSASPRATLVAAVGDKTALIVAAAGPDGAPYAGRAWGLAYPEPDRLVLRVILDAEDVPFLLARPGPNVLALTATHVRTLESVQFKGLLMPGGPITADDLEVVEAYCQAYFDAVMEVDDLPRALMERLVPEAFAAFLLEVQDIFDQTPGPAAGGAVSS
jgi:hypothetical protein